MMKARSIITVLVLVVLNAGLILATRHGSYVMNVDERFEEMKGETPWLLEFYAPWCGHCKSLEPTYEKVAARLQGTGIMVGKVDATLLTELATKYEVRGFPTILYIKGSKVREYRGDRSDEDLFQFAIRANLPPTGAIHSVGSLQDRIRRPGVFFMYVGENKGKLYELYMKAAEEFSLSIDFYTTTLKNMQGEISSDVSTPLVYVYKDGRRFQYETLTDTNLNEWIREEKFSALQPAKGTAFFELMSLNKKLVLLAVPSDKNDQRYQRILEVAKTVALDRNLRQFQFVHMESGKTINSIVLSKVELPYSVVLNPVTQVYHMLDKDLADMNEEDWKNYLGHIVRGNIQSYGGTGYFQQIKRALYSLVTSIIDIWFESRILFCVIIVIPLAVISLVVFTLCCMDGSPDDEEINEDSEDENEDKHTGHLKSE